MPHFQDIGVSGQWSVASGQFIVQGSRFKVQSPKFVVEVQISMDGLWLQNFREGVSGTPSIYVIIKKA